MQSKNPSSLMQIPPVTKKEEITHTLDAMLRALQTRPETVLKKLADAGIENIKKIQKICNAQYFNQSFYGNAALNRKMLLDPQITALLTSETITAIFALYILYTKEYSENMELPKPLQIKRNSTKTGYINLAGAINFCLADGLDVLKFMPNNEQIYNYSAYQQQILMFEQNVINGFLKNFAKSAQGLGIVASNLLDTISDDRSFSQKFQLIEHVIEQIKVDGKGNQLLEVPGYTTDDIRSQAIFGLKTACDVLNIKFAQDKNNKLFITSPSLEQFVTSFLSSKDALLNGTVSHLFYDRAHLEACMELNIPLVIGGKEYKIKDIIREMAKQCDQDRDNRFEVAKEQLNVRFKVTERDLHSKFQTTYGIKYTQLFNPPIKQVKTGQFIPTFIGYVKNSEEAQARAILAKVKKLHQQGHEKVGILYSANHDQIVKQIKPAYAAGKWKTGISGANQAKVMQEVEKLLATDEYKNLQNVFQILPISTCAKVGGLDPVQQSWLNEELQDIENFLESSQKRAIIAWQNEDANDKLAKKYAIGGSISKQLNAVIKDQGITQDEFIQRKLQALQVKFPANLAKTDPAIKPTESTKPAAATTTRPAPSETAKPSNSLQASGNDTPQKYLDRGSKFISDENIGKIEQFLQNNKDYKDWTVSRQIQNPVNNEPYRVVYNEKTQPQFNVHVNKFTTEKDDSKVYFAMLESFKKVHGGEMPPQITTHSEEAKDMWIVAMTSAYPSLKVDFSQFIQSTETPSLRPDRR